LVKVEFGFIKPRSIIKKVVRIKSLVAVKLKDAAVELIRSRFGDGIDHRPDRRTILRRIVLFKNLNLLNTVHANAVDSRFDPPQDVGCSVQIDTARVNSVDEDARPAKGRSDTVDTGVELM